MVFAKKAFQRKRERPRKPRIKGEESTPGGPGSHDIGHGRLERSDKEKA